MTAMEKVAWMQFGVSVAAIVAATLLIPWLGPRASGAFGLLGLVALSVIFMRRRDHGVVYDERDLEIERRATIVGGNTSWLVLVAALATAGTYASYTGTHMVSTIFLNWLIWVAMALLFATKGLYSIVQYRRHRHAA